MKNFKDKVAVVTGAAHGIGKSLVYAFANRGMKVVLADINQNALQELERDLREKHNIVAIKVTDVGDPNQVSELADFAYEKYGNVDILCNNAGICHSAAIRLLSLEDWNWVLQVNLLSVIYGVHYFLNRMLESDTPCHIVNTSSDYGLDSGKLLHIPLQNMALRH